MLDSNSKGFCYWITATEWSKFQSGQIKPRKIEADVSWKDLRSTLENANNMHGNLKNRCYFEAYYVNNPFQASREFKIVKCGDFIYDNDFLLLKRKPYDGPVYCNTKEEPPVVVQQPAVVSEEEKMLATLQQSQEYINPGTTASHKKRLRFHIHPGELNGAVPPGYICNNCGGDHFLQDCEQKFQDGPKQIFDDRKRKKVHGIPKNTLKSANTDEEKKTAMIDQTGNLFVFKNPLLGVTA